MRLSLDPNNYNACPSYNEWLDEQYLGQSGKDLDLFGYQPRPSFVLFTMSPSTYEATFSDFTQQREEEIKSDVWNDFPSPIAYYFYRFEKGYENQLQRLHFLRDTWESVIDILHALAVAEAKHHQPQFAQPLKFKDLLTDKVAQRLENIEHIVAQLSARGITSEIAKISLPITLDTMKELNQVRNAFSHNATQSEIQASQLISECYEDVLDILASLEKLREIQIVRYLGQSDVRTLRCELFKGHSLSKTILDIRVEAQQLHGTPRYFQQGKILAVFLNGLILDLCPMIHFHEYDSGHTTRLCVFRKTYGEQPNRRIEYGVVGGAPCEKNRTDFSAVLTELRRLFGLGAD